MKNLFIEKVLERSIREKKESDDFTYFFSLLNVGETLVKTITLGMLAAIIKDKDRNQYRLEYDLVHTNGIGDWSKALDDILGGPASHYLLEEARIEQAELTKNCRKDEWQYRSISKLKETLEYLNIQSEGLHHKSESETMVSLIFYTSE